MYCKQDTEVGTIARSRAARIPDPLAGRAGIAELPCAQARLGILEDCLLRRRRQGSCHRPQMWLSKGVLKEIEMNSDFAAQCMQGAWNPARIASLDVTTTTGTRSLNADSSVLPRRQFWSAARPTPMRRYPSLPCAWTLFETAQSMVQHYLLQPRRATETALLTLLPPHCPNFANVVLPFHETELHGASRTSAPSPGPGEAIQARAAESEAHPVSLGSSLPSDRPGLNSQGFQLQCSIAPFRNHGQRLQVHHKASRAASGPSVAVANK